MIPIDLLEDYLVDQEDGLKKLLTGFLNLVMQFEAMDQIEAEPYERADTRKAHRNGYKNRSLKTRVGELNLKKPQFREIPFQTKVFETLTPHAVGNKFNPSLLSKSLTLLGTSEIRVRSPILT